MSKKFYAGEIHYECEQRESAFRTANETEIGRHKGQCNYFAKEADYLVCKGDGRRVVTRSLPVEWPFTFLCLCVLPW